MAGRSKKTTGVVLGKFLPLHRGHQYLIDFARDYVDELVIIIGTRKTDSISATLRLSWMQEMFPGAQIIAVADTLPQEGQQRYWNIWKRTLQKNLPFPVDYIFASEDYGFKLAELLGATYVPVDHARELVPVSATAIRKDPFSHWQYLPDIVKPYFLKRVCIIGPESTGKTTLTRNLAKHFQTVYCSEYARGLLDFRQGNVVFGDIEKIAKGHAASENALARQANKVLFSDTDILTTAILSKFMFGKCPSWIRQAAENIRYDLYLLTDIDIPWVADPQRYHSDQREVLMKLFTDALQKRHAPYIRIYGSRMQRRQKAIQAVEQLFL
jgi:HTH-type transcriptional regulator, transcriptional repressor of NAD biosynthesis genes